MRKYAMLGLSLFLSFSAMALKFEGTWKVSNCKFTSEITIIPTKAKVDGETYYHVEGEINKAKVFGVYISQGKGTINWDFLRNDELREESYNLLFGGGSQIIFAGEDDEIIFAMQKQYFPKH